MESLSSHEMINQRVAVAKSTVLEQRARLEADLGKVGSQWKKDGSRVTETDHAISDGILGALAQAFPDDQGFSEELLGDQPIAVTSRFSWVLDPIDGTNNFALGLAQCAISLALLENGRPVYGLIYDHARRVLIHGGKGFGLWDGERSAHLSGRPLDRRSIVGFHSPHEQGRFDGHAGILAARAKIRALGSSALHLAYVAVGLFDGVVDHNVKLWDIAAGLALLEAAGGDYTFLANDPLPLKFFDVEMPRTFYVGGDASMVRSLSEALGGGLSPSGRD